MDEYKNKKLYTLVDKDNISSKVMLIEDVIDLLKEEAEVQPVPEQNVSGGGYKKIGEFSTFENI
jgi:hypothetical protein